VNKVMVASNVALCVNTRSGTSPCGRLNSIFVTDPAVEQKESPSSSVTVTSRTVLNSCVKLIHQLISQYQIIEFEAANNSFTSNRYSINPKPVLATGIERVVWPLKVNCIVPAQAASVHVQSMT
jgi:hypothetical protein